MRRDIKVDDQYGEWTVLTEPTKIKAIFYVEARCRCGTVKKVKKNNLLTGKSKSCGCIQRDQIGTLSKGKPSINAVTPEHKNISELMNSYKFHAKERNLTFDLTREEFSSLIEKNCFYCNAKPSNKRKVKDTFQMYNGIDRFDNNIGYKMTNCNPCCATCNKMKSNLDSSFFMEHVKNITNNNKINNNFNAKKLNAYHLRALASATLSHDIHTKVGALLINPKTGAVMAEGYNGFIRGAKDELLPTTRPEKYDYIIHAETNLLCNAVRSGVKTDDCIVYCTLSPCVKCIRMLWQAGISTFYFKDKYKDFEQSAEMLDLNIEAEQVEDHFLLTISPKNA